MPKYIFHIPSKTFPREFTKIQESVFCFPSKELNKCTDYKGHQYCLCVVVNSDTDSEVKKIIKDFIITLNIFHQEYDSIKWFSGINIASLEKVFDSIENIYSQYNNSNKFPQTFYFNFHEMPIHFFSLFQPTYSFIEVFNKLTELPESDFIYKSLSFLAIINPITMFTNKIYDNVLLENTLQFQLFETLMNEYDTESKELQTICPTCKRKNGRGINKRISDFFNLEMFKSVRDKTDFIKSAKKVAETRNKFSHNLKGKSAIAYYNEDILPKLGADKTLYLKEDIKYCDGTLQAVHNIKILNTLVLIDKLLQT